MRRTLIAATALALAAAPSLSFAGKLSCWFPPDWKEKGPQAKTICEALSKGSGETVEPRVAKSYPEILKAFGSPEPALVYAGSFVQAIIKARGLGTALAQYHDSKQLYGSWMILPKGQQPEDILKDTPAQVAFAVGASSGESGAKAATGGKASVGVPNHGAAAGAVKAGKAKAAFVKSWWWEANKDKFPELEVHKVPGVSDSKNPDNILAASKEVPEALKKKIVDAAMASSEAFGGKPMAAFDPEELEFSLGLMKKGKIDPKTYAWGD